MTDCWPPLLLLVLIPMNLVAVGLITGHVDRFLRRLPFNNLDLWDSLGGKGCSGCFNWLIALGIFAWTAVFLVMVALGAVTFC